MSEEKDASEELLFNTRRSPVMSQYGVVSSSQPLASVSLVSSFSVLVMSARARMFVCVYICVCACVFQQIGLSILQEGGNAVDACIAVAAALNGKVHC